MSRTIPGETAFEKVVDEVLDLIIEGARRMRVLRRGGRFAIFDVIAASDSPVHFPVPWAPGPETSFLLTADAMRAGLSTQGFRLASWIDSTDAGITWLLERV